MRKSSRGGDAGNAMLRHWNTHPSRRGSKDDNVGNVSHLTQQVNLRIVSRYHSGLHACILFGNLALVHFGTPLAAAPRVLQARERRRGSGKLRTELRSPLVEV